MPRGDGTGPAGQGSGAGKGQGSGRGTWRGAGPGGYCVCPACSTQVTHQQGQPCSQIACPNCGQFMIRK